MAVYFFLIGIWQIIGGLLFLNPDMDPGFNIFALSVPCFYFSVPLIYFYFKRLLNPSAGFTKKDGLHFILPLVSVLLLLPYFRTTVDLYQAMGFLRHSDYTPFEIIISSIMYSAMAVFLIYCIVLIKDTRLLLKKSSDGGKKQITLVYYFILFLTGLCVFWFLDRTLSLGLSRLSYFFVTTVMIMIYLVSYRYPQFLLSVRIEAEQIQYSNSQIEKIDIEEIIGKITCMMEEEKKFTSETLSLKSLARDLGITPHQLSELLNARLNKTFSSLVNEYRINEARNILVREPDRKIISIAYDVGFNSPSAFYNAFKKVSGMPPSRYREENQKS